MVHVILKNTEKNNKWTNTIFKSWREEQNKVFHPEEQVPDDLLSTGDPESLGSLAKSFHSRVRKKGHHAEYPPKHYITLDTVWDYQAKQS